MTTELPSNTIRKMPKPRWIPFWQEHGYYDADPDPAKQPHTIMIPLPNVTGALHMGHCLNGTLQDLLTRWRRMQGFEALWMPGTDHAGIGTQAVVERRMLEEEKTHPPRHRPRGARPADLEVEGPVRGPHPQPAQAAWGQLRLAADAVHARRHLLAGRAAYVLQPVQGRAIFRGKRLVNWTRTCRPPSPTTKSRTKR